MEILAHRVIWSLLFLMLLLAYKGQWEWIGQLRSHPKRYLPFLASALILMVNWFTYLWAVTSGHIVEASLGYFINPIFSVLLGVIFLQERLRRGQIIAVLIAFIGVVYLTLQYGEFPWIAITLALSFGVYGLLRKTASLGSLNGLSLEMIIMFLPAIAYLLFITSTGEAVYMQTNAGIMILLSLTGIATALPLLFFAYGAQRIPLYSIGLLQYIAPTLQFLLGVFLYHEPFAKSKLIGFSIIWLALLVYSTEGLIRARKQQSIRL